MTDREFIDALVGAYLSNTKYSHSTAFDDAFINRLRDIASKLERQETLKNELEKYKKLESKRGCLNCPAINGKYICTVFNTKADLETYILCLKYDAQNYKDALEDKNGLITATDKLIR